MSPRVQLQLAMAGVLALAVWVIADPTPLDGRAALAIALGVAGLLAVVRAERAQSPRREAGPARPKARAVALIYRPEDRP